MGIRWRAPIGVGSRDGNIVYVLLGAMAATGGIMLLADRNLRSGNEQALEFASEVARERNVAALNMLKTLISFPVTNPSPRNREQLPAIFPDVYVNTRTPLAVKMSRILSGPSSTSSGFWSIDPAGLITIKSLDSRFQGGVGTGSGFFSGQAVALGDAGQALIATKVAQVVPVYGRPPVKPASLITAYDVTVESTVPVSVRDPAKGTRKVTTKARIDVDAPPTPQCDISMSLAANGPPLSTSSRVRPGTGLWVSMKTFGVVFSARGMIPDGRGGRAWQAIALPGTAMSLRSTLNGGALVKTWPLTATSTHFESGFVVMKVRGMVTGPNGLSTTCDGSVIVDDGIPAVKVGINFEDHPRTGDRDYNDFVFCFAASVAFSPSQVVSRKDQTVVGQISKISTCDSDVRIEVRGPDEYVWSAGPFKASAIKLVRLPFRTGSRLHVSFDPGTCTDDPGYAKSMYDPLYSRLGPNCILTGN